MNTEVFRGVVPALMTPLAPDGGVDFDRLVETGRSLVAAGMSGVVYAGSMGDWPLLDEADRLEGVARLVGAGLPVVVGTGAINTGQAVRVASHAADVGAAGLMVIPRVLSRGASAAAQRAHFAAILDAAPDLPAVIYNSPYYGFATRADLFFKLKADHPNLVGFKEFGGAKDLSYAAETITSGRDDVLLMVGVDTEVVHGVVNCGAVGAITGVGNALPKEVLHLFRLAQKAATGDPLARRLAQDLDGALHVLSKFDEGPDLVLYYKRLMTLTGHAGYERQIDPSDALSAQQAAFLDAQYALFRDWYRAWSDLPEVAGT